MGTTIVFAEPKHGVIFDRDVHPKGGQVRLSIRHLRDEDTLNKVKSFFGVTNIKRGFNVAGTEHRVTYVLKTLGLEVYATGEKPQDGLQEYRFTDANGKTLTLLAEVCYTFFRTEPKKLPRSRLLVTIE